MKYDRVWLESRCETDGDCLIWQCSVQGAGYPQCRIGKKCWLVRRYVFLHIYNRRLEKGHQVGAKCGNRLCCAKDHLLSMSRGETLSMAYRSGKRNRAKEMVARRQRQIEVGVAKLTMEQAREIRRRRHEHTLAELARDYGVSFHTISQVCLNNRWREEVHGASVFTYRP